MILRKNFDKDDMRVLTHKDIQNIYTAYLKAIYQTEIIFSEIGMYKYDLRLDIIKVKRRTRSINIYEIKASRSDFKQDGKWSKYLPFCTALSFITQIGSTVPTIHPTELPQGIGLIEIIPFRKFGEASMGYFTNDQDAQFIERNFITNSIQINASRNKYWRERYSFIPTDAKLISTRDYDLFIYNVKPSFLKTAGITPENYITVLESIAFKSYLQEE